MWRDSIVDLTSERRASGKTKTIQQASLRKKIKYHFTSKEHAICVNQVDACENDAITKNIDKAKGLHAKFSIQYIP